MLNERGRVPALRCPRADDDETLDVHIKVQACTTYYQSTCATGRVVRNGLVAQGKTMVRLADSLAFLEVLAAYIQAPVVSVSEKCTMDMLP